MDEYTFKLDYESVQNMILQQLKEGFSDNEAFPEEPGYKKLRKAFLRLIKHYSCSQDWEAFKRSIC